jgi:N,N-dimethylformamidase beta subunit-like, C-terminal
VLAGLATSVAIAVISLVTPGVHAGTDSTTSLGTSTTSTAVRPSSVLGRDGVTSSAIIAENRRPGSRAWHITAQPRSGYIEGFANLTAARAGQRVTLYVSTSAARFRVQAFRMGYYAGKGGRLVWTSPWAGGRRQPHCPLNPSVNMVSCDNWRASLTMPIGTSFVQGDYLLKLTGSGGQQSYVPLTVWDPNSRAAYLVVARSLTEEGWNTFGGYDYYQGLGPCIAGPSTYPPCNRALVVSFDRPYAQGQGASDFLGNEFPLVFWAEQHGLDVAYVTDVTLSEHPGLMLNHRAVLSLGHDETWTNTERLGALTAIAHGVNVVFFGSVASLRHSRLQPSPLGPDREEVDYRNGAIDPLNGRGDPMNVTGNTWSSPPSNWSETIMTGEAYAGYGIGGNTFPFVVYDASSWLFRGTGLVNGSAIPGVIKSDFDHVNLNAPTPAGLQVLGHSPLPVSGVYTNQGVWSGQTYSDATYWSDPRSKAGVFDSGTVNWISALESCGATSACPAREIQAITGNLLRLFGQGPAGRLEPSHPNAAALLPPGS